MTITVIQRADRIAPEDAGTRLPRHGDDELLHRSRSAREAASRTGVRLAEAPTARSSETPFLHRERDRTDDPACLC